MHEATSTPESTAAAKPGADARSQTSPSPGERRFLRELAIVLSLKLAAIGLLWYLFFGPTHEVKVTPAALDRHLFTAPAPQTPKSPRS